MYDNNIPSPPPPRLRALKAAKGERKRVVDVTQKWPKEFPLFPYFMPTCFGTPKNLAQ